MKESYIKVIGIENTSTVTRVSFEPTAFISLGNEIFTNDRFGIIRIPHDFDGYFRIYIDGKGYIKESIPGIFSFNPKTKELLRLYRQSTYSLTLDYDYSKRKQLSEVSNELHNIINQKFDNSVITFEYDQEGSIKKKVIVYGALAYMGIANYGSFRSGLREINNDLNWVGDKIGQLYKSNNAKVKGNKTTIDFSKDLLDEISIYENASDNFSHSTDKKQQSLKQIKTLVSTLHGRERQIVYEGLKEMNIPLDGPNDSPIKLIDSYAYLKDDEDDIIIKTDANIR